MPDLVRLSGCECARADLQHLVEGLQPGPDELAFELMTRSRADRDLRTSILRAHELHLAARRKHLSTEVTALQGKGHRPAAA